MARVGLPAAYRPLLASRQMRLLLAGLGVSSLGDGISTVTIAWLAVRTAPAGSLGLFVGLAVAAYTLPGVVGALAFGRMLRGRPARATPLGTALGGPIVAALGGGGTLVGSGVSTVLLAAAGTAFWRERDRAPVRTALTGSTPDRLPG